MAEKSWNQGTEDNGSDCSRRDRCRKRDFSSGLEDGHISQHTFTYEDLGMEKVELSDITGGDAKENAEILLSVLKNEVSPYLETTVLNAGLGFFANGKVETIKEGVELARQLIADGSALEKLRQLQEVQV